MNSHGLKISIRFVRRSAGCSDVCTSMAVMRMEGAQIKPNRAESAFDCLTATVCRHVQDLLQNSSWRLRAFTLADRRPFLAHQSGPCVPCFGMTTWTLKTPFHRASFQGDPHSHPLHRGTPPPPPTSATEPARPGPRKRSPRPTRSLRRPVRQSGVDRVLGRPLGPGGLHQEGGGASDGGG